MAAATSSASIIALQGAQFTAAPPQHRLYFFPEPQGQGSFPPTSALPRRDSGTWPVGARLFNREPQGRGSFPPTSALPRRDSGTEAVLAYAFRRSRKY